MLASTTREGGIGNHDLGAWIDIEPQALPDRATASSRLPVTSGHGIRAYMEQKTLDPVEHGWN